MPRTLSSSGTRRIEDCDAIRESVAAEIMLKADKEMKENLKFDKSYKSFGGEVGSDRRVNKNLDLQLLDLKAKVNKIKQMCSPEVL